MVPTSAYVVTNSTRSRLFSVLGDLACFPGPVPGPEEATGGAQGGLAFRVFFQPVSLSVLLEFATGLNLTFALRELTKKPFA